MNPEIKKYRFILVLLTLILVLMMVLFLRLSLFNGITPPPVTDNQVNIIPTDPFERNISSEDFRQLVQDEEEKLYLEDKNKVFIIAE